MSVVYASSQQAKQAHRLVQSLQNQLVSAMGHIQGAGSTRFQPVHWLRDQGRHGGGVRFVADECGVFNRASVNVSQVHYDDQPNRSLSSATALSAILHPLHARSPSLHLHISLTEMRNHAGYWRIMADLNPAIPHQGDKQVFLDSIRGVAPQVYNQAVADGNKYFYIPALGRHRGVAHVYVEGYRTAHAAADQALAEAVGTTVITTYAELLAGSHARPTSPEDAFAQLAYHTLYFFQVLTLDRGTTSGLLVHNQNDVGILGSLPSHIDRELLASWQPKVPELQQPLVAALLDALPIGVPTPVSESTKQTLANALRAHYQTHPQALDLQAAGSVIPPTVANHLGAQPA